MPRLTPDQRLLVYDLKVQKISYMNIALRFSAQFPGVPAPSRRAIFNVRKKMMEHKTLLDRNKGNSGPRRTTRSDDNILRVYESALDDSKLSLRKNSAKLGVPRATLQKIMTKDLRLYPYRISNRHSMEQRDLPARVRLADWFLGRCSFSTRTRMNLQLHVVSAGKSNILVFH